jgi:hypothetical protein
MDSSKAGLRFREHRDRSISSADEGMAEELSRVERHLCR